MIRRKVGTILPSFFQATGLKPFASDSAYDTAKGGGLENGDAYYNTTLDEIRVYDADSTTWKTVLTAENDGTFNVADTTASTSSTTGALTVAGGMGIADDLYIGVDLDVTGSATIDTDLTVGNDVTITGDLTVNGTTTTVNTTNLDVTDANITVNDGGNQATANSQVAGLTVEMSDATDARIGYDSTSATLFKAGASGSEVDLVGTSSTQTLTNKTIDGDDNTLQDINITSLKTDAGAPNVFIHRDGSGVVDDTKAMPSGAVVGTTDTQTLTNKTIDGDDNTIQDLALSSLKDTANTNVFIQRDGLGAAIDSSKAVPTGDVVGTSDTQTLTNKTIDADSNTITNIENADIKAGAAIARSKIAAGTANHVIINDGSGNLNQEATLALTRGGTGQDNSSVTFPASGTLVTETATQTLTNKTLTSPVLNTSVSGTAVLDEDNMVSDSATQLATQQSIKAYVDTHESTSSGIHGVTGSIVGTTDTQDLSNKTFTDAITLEEQASTPSTPASGDKKFYAKNDGKLYTLDDAGNEIEVGSGAGGGGVLYINEDFETGVANLVAYADAASDTPVDGTGGSPNITVAVESTDELRGDQSASVTKDAVNRQGEGVAILSDTIDEAYDDKVHAVEFLWKTDSSYADGDMALFVVHPTTGTVEALNFRNSLGEYTNSLPKSDGTVTRIVSELTPIDSTYRIVLHIASTSATGYEVIVDDIKCGPQRTFNAALVTEWESVTVTGSWSSNTGYEAYEKRIGDTAYYKVAVSLSGAPDATALTITLPSGRTIDTAKMAAESASHTQLWGGTVNILDSGTVVKSSDSVVYESTTSVRPYYNSSGNSASITSTAPITFANGDRVWLNFSVPIEGWDAGAAFSTTQVDQQTIQAVYEVSSSTANSSFADASAETVDYDIEVVDTHNAVTTGASWVFTAPRSGRYLVVANMNWDNTTNMDRTFLSFRKNGTAEIITGDFDTTARGTNGQHIFDLASGDTIDVQAYQDDSGGSARSINTTANRTAISVTSLPDFSAFGTFPEKNLVQTKVLSADATSNGTVSDLTFSNLTIGRWYEVSGSIRLAQDVGSADINVSLNAVHDGSNLNVTQFNIQEASDSNTDIGHFGISFKFQATATSLTFEAAAASANSYVAGDGSQDETFIQLEERNDLRETSKF